ncbi:MAG: hypothetical protein EU541_08020 [Promethearchaeota archaeon]|nr:MAG: hypothetical protein EU541_08020 [Candidatus Lokiarchaeota archaeon]
MNVNEIHEVGIIAGGIPLVSRRYTESERDRNQNEKEQEQQNIFKSAYISSILAFAEKLSDQVEYFEMKKKHITFKKDQINSEDVYAYIILENEKNFGKIFEKAIKPLLEEIIIRFRQKYGKLKSFTDVSQFEEFKSFFDEKVEELTKSRFQSFKDKIF